MKHWVKKSTNKSQYKTLILSLIFKTQLWQATLTALFLSLALLENPMEMQSEELLMVVPRVLSLIFMPYSAI
jgi:hypothetical protein